MVLNWNAFNVHVESGFEVQRLRLHDPPPGESWETVSGLDLKALPVPALGSSQVQTTPLEGEEPGTRTYRLVSVTSAPGQTTTQWAADNPSASQPVTVLVMPDPVLMVSIEPRWTASTVEVSPVDPDIRVSPGHSYYPGTQLTLRARPESSTGGRHWVLDHWKFADANGNRVDRNGNLASAPGPLTIDQIPYDDTDAEVIITLNVDMTATAVFASYVCPDGTPPCELDRDYRPVFPSSPIQPFVFTADAAKSHDLPKASRGDGVVRYSLAVPSDTTSGASGQSQTRETTEAPSWLSVTVRADGTPVLSGAPPPDAVGTTTYTLTVTDDDGTPTDLTDDDTDSVTITVTVNATLTLSPGAGGRLTASPEQTSYSPGESVTVTADPDSGKRVASWGDDCAGTSRTDDCGLVMSTNKTASVTFETIPPPPPPPPTPTPPVIIHLVADEFTDIVWPGRTQTVGTATRHAPIGFSLYYWVDDVTRYLVYIKGAPAIVNSLTHVYTGRTYTVVARGVDYTWVIPVAGASSRDAAATIVPASGWTATVTCDTGPGPFQLGVAPTEAEAVGAATWFIDSPLGCDGAGTYTTSPPASDAQ